MDATIAAQSLTARALVVVLSLALVSLAAVAVSVRHPHHANADIIVIVPGCVVKPPDLIAWWKGEGNLAAEVGPALIGTSGYEPALIGQGLVFDGTNTLSVSRFPVVSSGLSVEMWIKPVANGLVQALASRWDFPGTDDSARTFSLLLGPRGQLIFDTDETTARRPEELQTGPQALYDGFFHHVAATWNQTEIALYVDGSLVTSKPSQGGTLNPAATTAFRLGSQLGLGDQFHYTGTIDEPAIVQRALTAAEVTGIVNAGPKSKCLS
jgi:hypothetical protein